MIISLAGILLWIVLGVLICLPQWQAVAETLSRQQAALALASLGLWIAAAFIESEAVFFAVLAGIVLMHAIFLMIQKQQEKARRRQAIERQERARRRQESTARRLDMLRSFEKDW